MGARREIAADFRFIAPPPATVPNGATRAVESAAKFGVFADFFAALEASINTAAF